LSDKTSKFRTIAVLEAVDL